MKFLNLIEKLNSKKRPVNVVYFGVDSHIIKQLSKELAITEIGNDKCFYNKVRTTCVFDNENAYVKTANLNIDFIIVDKHLDNGLIGFINSKIEENKKIKILSFFNNNILKEKMGLKVRKKEYYEYYL